MRRPAQKVTDESGVSGDPGSHPPSLDIEALAVMPSPVHEDQDCCSCSRKTSKDEASKNTCVRYMLLMFEGLVWRCPCQIVLFTSVSVLVFVIGIAAGAELAQGIPKIFPPGHNQVESAEWQGKFHTVTSPKSMAGLEGAVCDVNYTSEEAKSGCILHWCQARTTDIVGSSDGTSGQCWQAPIVRAKANANATSEDPAEESEGCDQLSIETRIATDATPSSSAWWRNFQDTALSMLDSGNSVVHGGRINSVRQKVKPTEDLVQENWESGMVSVSRFWSMGSLSIRSRSWNITQGSPDKCSVQTVCYFGVPACDGDLEDWTPLGTFSLSGRRLGSTVVQGINSRGSAWDPMLGGLPSEVQIPQPRALAVKGPLLPSNKRIDITVVFGIRAAASTPLVGAPEEHWSYDPSFEPDNPWAQRAMYAMCENLPESLAVITTRCWVSLFRSWLIRSGDRFPSREFDAKIVKWFPTTIQAPQNIWMVNNKMKANKISYLVNRAKDMSADAALEYMALWEEFTSSRNNVASETASRAFYTGSLFVRAEAEKAIIDSTVETIIISAVCGWCGMLVFTQDLILSCVVLILVLGIISGLAFFMVVVYQWPIGPVEVISLVVFVGYSVTYALHIAHSYSEARMDDVEMLQAEKEFQEKAHRRRETGRRRYAAQGVGAQEPASDAIVEADLRPLASLSALTPAELRRARTRISMLRVGGAILSSSVSTLGSSMFLLFCTMNIFVKLGSVVITVTLFSILFALAVLPATLMLVGPSPDPTYCKFIRRMLGLSETRKRRGRGREAEDDPSRPLVAE